MGTYTTNWEDEENNRIVEFSVDYKIADNGPAIERIVPQAVSFVCETSGEIKRRIGVHTATGQSMLARQFELHVGTEGVLAAIDESLSVPA